MFTDPQTVTINAIARTLPRTGMNDNTGNFRESLPTSGASILSVSHTFGKRNRDVLRFTDTKTTADPLLTGSSFVASLGVNLTIDAPPTGYTVAEKKLVVDGILAWLTASSGANITRLLNGES